ncbi:phage tail protein [Seohaeicola saemankumensis]|uniref:phage tail protein n=2 Tax=Seohaeicola TaxID=481178 RepID=UPI0035CF8502
MPPVGAAIAAVGAAISGTVAAISAFAASSFIASMIVNTAISVGVSLIARALTPKPTIKQSGIQTAVTTTGGTEPQGFILGRTATAGHHVCPPMSHDDGGTPNGLLTYVIELSDLAGIGLSRVILNDGYSVLSSTAHPDYGFPLLGQRIDGTDHAWIKFYDGTQTAADPMLVAKYANYPDRPWSESFIGHGTAYAILTFRYNREVFNNLPTVRFELDGIPLYDPRFDSSVGGSGPQRWSNPATWARSANPAVMIYNILRGIRLPTGEVWGGDVPADDLPFDNWVTAMNACDAPMGSRPSFVAGLEVKLEMEPAEVIDELAKTCLGQVSEMGGVFRMRVGAPSAPVQFITDEDIVISAPQELDPFPGLAVSANAIASEYPEPASLWTSRAAPPLFNPTWEAEDGGRRLSTSLNFPACSEVSQVAQLMSAYIKDARRFRTHRLVLPPEAFLLEPLDTIAWTSTRNGYTNKIFEVVEITDQPGTINQELVLRERDPGDYGWTASQDLPALVPVTGLAPRPPQIIAGWSVAASTLKDALGLDRRPAITLSWVGSAALDALFVRYEIRLKATTQVVASGLADRAAGSVLVSEGLLPNTDYEVRGRYVLDRPTDWSSWLDVTTPGVYLNGDDLRGGIKGLMDDAGLAPVEILATLPETGNVPGRVVFLTTDAKLYRWTGNAWSREIAAGDITGELGAPGSGTTLAGDAVLAGIISAGGISADLISVSQLSAISAELGTFQSAASGERVVIEDDRISVFDAANQLRVRIGRL